MKNLFFKKVLAMLSLLPPMMLLTTVTSCSKDYIVDPNNNNNYGGDNNRQDQEIVVTVDANGNADGGHSFTRIDETSFYIDALKYAVIDGNLAVSGYDPVFFTGAAKPISKLIYNGRTFDVVGIADNAFKNSTVLTSITIGKNITRIGRNAFEGCSDLKKVIVPDIAAWCGISFGSNPLCYAHHLYSNEITEITNLVIPNGVTSISDDSFSGSSGLTSVSIPNSVTRIGGGAFKDCSSLTSIIIPNSVTSIWYDAFDGCYFVHESFVNKSSLTAYNNWNATLCDKETSDGLLIKGNALIKCRPWATSVIIPSNVTSIDDKAFYGCRSLTFASIPNSVTTIGSNAFRECNELTSVTIGCGVTNIYNCAFYGCSGLKKVIVPDIAAWCGISFDGIGVNPLEYAHHLYSNETTEITNLVIPNGVTGINWYAFYGCSSLTSVIIPNSMISIGGYAFSGCSSLTDVYCHAIVPPHADYSFDISHIKEHTTLHVPDVSYYSMQETWEYFKNIIAIPSN